MKYYIVPCRRFIRNWHPNDRTIEMSEDSIEIEGRERYEKG